MRFYADLHVHSKYSRATSKKADLEHLAYWAAKKGIALVGTGDFTHPAWIQEIKDKLVPAEPGLFRLRPEIETEIKQRLPAACRDNVVRFMLEVEISTIYKKDEKTRKVHHLIYAPHLAAAERLIVSLSRIGNLKSDGRPILGLDSRDLLEITLQSDEHSYLIPAHIWTPWFAAMGSKSGFDSIDDCYGDLADHIFAVETGLSSDPEMNWRISSLDRYRLVSNSDAHSPIKLGREATAFDGALDYFGIKHALETGEGYAGTVEFFPDEGKYHLDGHRKCGVRFTPEQTKRRDGRCPSCGEPLTVGVLHRVDELADRRPAEVTPPSTAGEAVNLVPLHEVIGEIEGTKPGSKRVERSYQHLVTSLGSELDILNVVPIEDIRSADSSLLGEAISRLRAGDVIREAGYDGEYGVIRLFDDDELREAKSGGLLFDLPKAIGEALPAANPMASAPIPKVAKAGAERTDQTPAQSEAGGASHQSNMFPRHGILAALDDQQRAAAAITRGPVLIIAGPGSGKTRTLTHRIAHLVAEEGVPARNCLAITFTRRAALEMRGRLERLLPDDADAVPIHTFHSLGQTILQEQPTAARLPADFRVADDIERTELIKALLDISPRQAKKLLADISRSKRTAQRAGDEVAAALEVYQPELVRRGWVDFDDLIGLTVRLLRNHDDLAAYYRERYAWISVDEFQDIDEQQYRMIQLLAPFGQSGPGNSGKDANILAIGDPNQAIYGFRGADPESFQRFHQDYPNACMVTLRRNYRSSGTIVKASGEVIEAGEEGAAAGLDHVREMEERITIHRAASDKAEAEFIVHSIERLIGGHSFYSIDTGRTSTSGRIVDAGRSVDAAQASGYGRTTGSQAVDRHPPELSFADFAVLYRTDAQAKAVIEAFERSGMPYKKHNHDLLIEETAAQAILHRVDPVAKATASDELKAAAAAVMRDAEADEIADLEAMLQQLLALAMSCEDRLDWFVDAVPLATEADCFDPRADRVSLLTIHAAKGLEFPVVFMIGMEDGILPLTFGKAASDAELAEERRLAFVGMTRAMDRLFLTHAAKRTWRGASQELAPSPFLSDLSEALFNTSRSDVKRKPQDRQLQLF
ncbi:MAG: UvrD-helicase domain-containing protein [Alphaproteobacteria bacterium]|nr:UvrD-helicase domain-containing protein [Alphaproteobacteria bacterium]